MIRAVLTFALGALMGAALVTYNQKPSPGSLVLERLKAVVERAERRERYQMPVNCGSYQTVWTSGTLTVVVPSDTATCSFETPIDTSK